MEFPRLRSAAYAALLSATTLLPLPALALDPADDDLIPDGRAVLNYLESQMGQKLIAGNMPHPRYANTQQLIGRRGAIWHFELNPLQDEQIDALIEDYLKYRPILMLQQSWWWDPDGDGTGYRGNEGGNIYGEELWQIPPDIMERLLEPTSFEHSHMNEVFDGWIAKLKRFQDAGVPVIWSPFNEICGGWFWWSDSDTPENSAALYRYMFNYFEAAGLNNLIWCYNHGQINTPLTDDNVISAVDYQQRFFPGEGYVDMLTVGQFNSNNIYDRDAQWEYFERMDELSGNVLLIGDAEVRRLPNPDYMAEGHFPFWGMAVPWEGAPHRNEDHSVSWADYTYGHEHVITIDELPKYGPSDNLFPEVAIIEPDQVTWTYDSDPVIEALAADRDGSVTKVEFYANGELIGTDHSAPYRFVWEDAPAGHFKVSAKAYDDSGNVSDSLDMGNIQEQKVDWSSFAWIMNGYFNAAKFKPVNVSSLDENVKAEWLTDGRYETAWDSAWHSPKQPADDDQWFTVDLGQNFPVNKVIVRYGWKVFAENLYVDVKADGASAWQTDVYVEEGFEGDQFWGAFVDCELPEEMQVRHIRVRLRDRVRGIGWDGFTVGEIEVPVALSSIPAGTANALELYNKRVFWNRQFPRTAFATPASVEASGSNHVYQKDYFDVIDESFCSKVSFGDGFGTFDLSPYGSVETDLTEFSSGVLHFWASSDVSKPYTLRLVDASGAKSVATLDLTADEWREFTIPVSEIVAAGVDLSTVKSAFSVSKTGAPSTFYVRDLFWTTDASVLTAPENIVVDGSFESDEPLHEVKKVWFDHFAEDLGWLVYRKDGDLREPKWAKDIGGDNAYIAPFDNNDTNGLAQVIADHRATTGSQNFSFSVESVDSASDNALYAQVWGVNTPNWQVRLVDNLISGPLDQKTLKPSGVLLADALVEGAFSGEVEVPMDLASGYERIIILFWNLGVDPALGESLTLDNVSISPVADPDDSDNDDANGTGSDTILEPFDWASALPGSLSSGVADGKDGLVWTFDRAFHDGEKSIDGSSVLLQRMMGSGAHGSLTVALPGDISGFSIQFKPRYGGDTQIRVTVDGVAFESDVITGDSTVGILAADIAASAGSILVIETMGSTANKDSIIDNLELIGTEGNSGGPGDPVCTGVATLDFADLMGASPSASLSTTDANGCSWTFAALDNRNVEVNSLIDGATLAASGNGTEFTFARSDGAPFSLSVLEVFNQVWVAATYTLTGTTSGGTPIEATFTLDRRSSDTIPLGWTDIVSVHVDNGGGNARLAIDNVEIAD